MGAKADPRDVDLDSMTLEEIVTWMVDVPGWHPDCEAHRLDNRYSNTRYRWHASFTVPWTADHHYAVGDNLRLTLIAAIRDAFDAGHNGEYEECKNDPDKFMTGMTALYTGVYHKGRHMYKDSRGITQHREVVA